ncbi:damage-inducible protein DinB [Sphingobacteriaceae bacterium]|nr:damage-inducible protein DinB [Sphingobacteriaceae bacterium]
MDKISNYARQHYEFVKDSRSVLLNYCQTIRGEDFTRENSAFGRGGSMRNLLVHITNVYEYWVAEVGLNKSVKFSDCASFETPDDINELFVTVNSYMDELIVKLEDPDFLVTYVLHDDKKHVTLFKLFSHVISHEYHHKGQILSISRQLGYTPVDTDMIR